MADDRLMFVDLVINELSDLDGIEIDSECLPMRRRKDGKIELKAIAPERSVKKLKAMADKGVSVRAQVAQVPNASSIKKLVSHSNRYAKGALPHGVGKRRK